MDVTIVASVLLGLLVVYWVLYWRNFFQRLGIPHKVPWPLMGNMGSVVLQRTSLVELLQKFYNFNRQAKYIGLFNFSTPVILLRDPELIKLVTVRAFDHFTDHRGFIEPEQDPFFTASTFSLRGDAWRRMRAHLTPAFTSAKIKIMFPLVTKCAANFGDHLVERFASGGHLDLKDAFSRCTNDVIATCEYGCEVDSMRDPENDFFVLGRSTTDFSGPISVKFFLASNFPRLFKLFGIKMIESNVAEFFANLVKETIRYRSERNISRPDVLQILMEMNHSGQAMSLDDMAAQAFSFFFASFDTLSTMMCFGFYEIAINPAVQKRLQAEVDDLLNRTNGQPTYDDVIGLEYLEAVISETLRIHSAANFTDRVCTKAFELPPPLPGSRPVVVQPGQTVWIPIWQLHRDPQYFPEPQKFRPERFLGEARSSIVPGTYLPFGNGPRICLGHRFAMFEAKIVFFQVIARCEFSLSERMKMPFQYLRSSFASLPVGGFWLKVRVRESWKNRKY